MGTNLIPNYHLKSQIDEWKQSKNQGGGEDDTPSGEDDDTMQGVWAKILAATDAEVTKNLLQRMAVLMQNSDNTIPSPTQMERLQCLTSTDMVANDLELKQAFEFVEVLYQSRRLDMRSLPESSHL